MKHIPRVYVEEPLESNREFTLPDRCKHHLLDVLKVENDDRIKLFNQTYGEWLSDFRVYKKNITAVCLEKTNFYKTPKLKISLAFSLVNPNKVHFILEKCTEIGTISFIPLITDYSQYSTLNIEKANKILISAVEQCGRLDIPDILPPVPLANFLANRQDGEYNIVADATGAVPSSISQDFKYKSITVIIGPEGGFSEKELCRFNEESMSILRFGEHIMRTETACVVSISQLQALLD